MATDLPPLRLTISPDDSPAEVGRRFQPFVRWLISRLGRPVVHLPASDPAAAVEALVTQKVDLGWLSGLDWLQAQARASTRLLPLVRPEDDNLHRWVLVTSDPGVHRLTDLVGRDVCFGSANSVVSHLAPRAALMQAGIQIDKDARRIAFGGTSEATLGLLASGKLANGLVHLAAWERWLADRHQEPGRLRAVVISQPVADGLWVVQGELPTELRENLQASLLALNLQVPAERDVLAALRTRRLMPAQAQAWTGLQASARAAGLLPARN